MSKVAYIVYLIVNLSIFRIKFLVFNPSFNHSFNSFYTKNGQNQYRTIYNMDYYCIKYSISLGVRYVSIYL